MKNMACAICFLLATYKPTGAKQKERFERLASAVLRVNCPTVRGQITNETQELEKMGSTGCKRVHGAECQRNYTRCRSNRPVCRGRRSSRCGLRKLRWPGARGLGHDQSAR